MNKLELTNFKAFSGSSTIEFDKKNALIYGENGSGKSSIFEALNLWFNTQKIFSHRIDSHLTVPADIANAKNDVLDSYNNQKHRTTRFSMLLNGTVYNNSVSPTGYNACLICREDIMCTDTLNVNNILENAFVGITDPDAFIRNQKQDIEDLINATLNQDFGEPNVKVTFHYNGSFWLLNIEDTEHGLTKNEDLTKYFNEGKIHLIVLLLLLSAAQLNGSSEPKKVLVIDDVFTSLDAANRTFFTKYLHDYFGGWQKIIMTHSVSLFNQMEYSFRTIWNEYDNWKLFKILSFDNNTEVRGVVDTRSAKELRNSYKRNPSAPSLPNEVRKRFEYLVGEIASCMSIGGSFECGSILKEINNNQPFYYRFDRSHSKKFLTIYDLLGEIKQKLDASPSSRLKTELEAIISPYRSNTELDKLNIILQSLMLYQKVTMHSGSHSTGTLSPLTQTEMDKTILLLQKLEDLMKNLFNRDMYSI